MGRNVAYNRIGQFGKDLQRELPLLEQSIIDKLRKDDQAEFGPFTRTPLQTSTYTARPWEIVLCDPTAAAFSIILPDPSSSLAVGSWIGIKNDTDSVVAISAVAINSTIDGQAIWRSVAARMFQWFFSSGAEWKQGPSHFQQALPRLSTAAADANTVALWPLDPPGNGNSGLVDVSGNGLTLEVVGTAGYGELGYGQEGAAFDGTNYWRRAGSANDAILNTTFLGDHTISMLVRPTSQPNGMTVFDYGAPTAGTVGTNALANINLKLANAAGGPNVANSITAAYFYQTGAGVNHTVNDSKIFPINQPQHIAVVYSGATVTFFVNGFRQSVTGGQTARSALVTPTQFVHIGVDHNAAFPFTGYIGSVKVSNIARSEAYIYAEAARCLGVAYRGVIV